MKKYLVIPGHVFSQNDDQQHYIGAGQLMRLYGVDPKECIIIDTVGLLRGLETGFYGNMPQLVPRPNGDYRLPS